MNASQRFATRGAAAIVVSAVSWWFVLSAVADEGQGPELRPAVVERATVDENVEPASFELPSPVPRPEERDAAFAAGIEEVRRSGILETARRVGDKAVDFELPEAGGRNLRLSELWAVGPVVLVYYRGGWCPFCSRHLQSLQKVLLDIHAQDAQLVAVSPETPPHGLATEIENKLTFPVLSDRQNVVARRYGIVYRISDKVLPYYDQFFDISQYNGDRSNELPLAATYVIDSDGIIRYAFLDADYTHRADPQSILDVLRRLKRDSPARPTTQPLARR